MRERGRTCLVLFADGSIQFLEQGIRSDTFHFLQMLCAGIWLQLGDIHTTIFPPPWLGDLENSISSNLVSGEDQAGDLRAAISSLCQIPPGMARVASVHA